MSLSVVPLLLVEEEIPPEVRRALVENRLQDAAGVLIREYRLSCAGALFMHRIWRSISTRKAFRQVTYTRRIYVCFT